jgi:phage shock protein A
MENQLTTNKIKGFWDRPEGTAGMLVMGGGLLAGGIILYKALPFLIEMAQNIIYLGIMGSIIFTAGVILLDPKARTLISYFYRVSMRKLTGVFVQLDPIAIIKTYISDLKEKMDRMNEQISKLRGEMNKLSKTISTNSEEIDNFLTTAEHAKRKLPNITNENLAIQTKFAIASNLEMAGKTKASNDKLIALKLKLENLSSTMDKLRIASKHKITMIEHDVKVQETEYNASKSSYSVMKSAQAIIAGNTGAGELYNDAMEYMASDISIKLGEVEQFVKVSEDFLMNADLEKGVYQEKGLQMLEKFMNDGMENLFTDVEVIENKPKSNTNISNNKYF